MAAYVNVSGSGKSNLNVQASSGDSVTYNDFGGLDIYTLAPTLINGDITINDKDNSVIVFYPGLTVTSARFAMSGFEMTVNDHTVKMIGNPANFTFVFGGNPLVADPLTGITTEGTPKTYAETAIAFGTQVPAIAGKISDATIVGEIMPDGTINAVADSYLVVTIADGERIVAQAGVAEAFVINVTVSGGYVYSNDIAATIEGFVVGEDIIRFNDSSVPPASETDFLEVAAAGFSVDPFAGATNLCFMPTDSSHTGASIVLNGVQDATLGNGAYFEVV